MLDQEHKREINRDILLINHKDTSPEELAKIYNYWKFEAFDDFEFVEAYDIIDALSNNPKTPRINVFANIDKIPSMTEKEMEEIYHHYNNSNRECCEENNMIRIALYKNKNISKSLINKMNEWFETNALYRTPVEKQIIKFVMVQNHIANSLKNKILLYTLVRTTLDFWGRRR